MKLPMEVWISLTSSLKVALLRLIDLLLHRQQSTAQTVLVKFTFLCIISVLLLTNAAAISAFSFGLYTSFYRGSFSSLLYTDNTCGCSEKLSFLGNKLIFLLLPSHTPQMSKPRPFGKPAAPGPVPPALGGGTRWSRGGSGAPGEEQGQGCVGQGRTGSAPKATTGSVLHGSKGQMC